MGASKLIGTVDSISIQSNSMHIVSGSNHNAPLQFQLQLNAIMV